MATKTTRKGPGKLTNKKREQLPDSTFAYPKERKEPLNSASHVKDALARFDQVKGVSDSERTKAFQRIKRAAGKYGIHVEESNWHELGKHPHTRNRAHAKKS